VHESILATRRDGIIGVSAPVYEETLGSQFGS
jgi:hypothetical protein